MTTSTLAINVPLIGSITQLDTVDYYFIDISNATATLEHVNMSTFKISDVFPNPVSDVANFQFVIGKSENIINDEKSLFSLSFRISFWHWGSFLRLLWIST